jgi:RNase P subunit RPR2
MNVIKYGKMPIIEKKLYRCICNNCETIFEFYEDEPVRIRTYINSKGYEVLSGVCKKGDVPYILCPMCKIRIFEPDWVIKDVC